MAKPPQLKPKVVSKPKPAPSPTSYTQLKIDKATMAYVKKDIYLLQHGML